MLRSIHEANDPPGRIDDFGFHYDYRIVQMAYWFLRNFHVLPEGGGWMDQDHYLINDIVQWHNLVASIESDDNSKSDPLANVPGMKIG